MVLFDGIVLSVMADTGPVTEINLSKLDETSTMKLSISLMTALGLGESQDQLNQLHGSFPVPGRKELAIAYPFKVSSQDSSDPRITEFGRYCTIFLLFPRENKGRVLANYSFIESLLAKELQLVSTQHELNLDLMKNLYSHIESTVSTREGSPAAATIKQSTSDLEQIQVDHEKHQVLSGIIREITQVQTSIGALLDESMVFTDTPILEGAFYMRPNIKPEDYVKILPQITRYEKILARLARI